MTTEVACHPNAPLGWIIKPARRSTASVGLVWVGHFLRLRSGQALSNLPAKERIPDWEQDGWGAAIIVDVGRAFDFLAWYRPVTLFAALTAKPVARLRSLVPWVLKRPGTCSAIHFKRMELEKIGMLPVDGVKLHHLFPEMKAGNYQAINDISIANELSVKPSGSMPAAEKPPKGFRVDPAVSNLEDILSS